MSINIGPPSVEELRPRITVIGVGGAGGNAIANMIAAEIEGVDFIVANTDAQALNIAVAEHRIQLGPDITQGLGAGSRPEVGRAAAEETVEEIERTLEGVNMVFIAAGMGGGTGTGAAPVIAEVARSKGILTVGVVTKPFLFEGTRRMRAAEAGIEELQKQVDTLIVIPNQNLFLVAKADTTFKEAFQLADEVLQQGVRSITDLMVMPGLINLDFADVRSVMNEMGKAMMGTGEGEGPNRALEAAERAIANPLLDGVSMQGAKGVIISIIGGEDMKLLEVDEAANHIRELVDPEANIIWGSAFNPDLDGKIRVSVVATGIEQGATPVQPSSRPLDLRSGRGPRLPGGALPAGEVAQHRDAASPDHGPDHEADDDTLDLAGLDTETLDEANGGAADGAASGAPGHAIPQPYETDAGDAANLPDPADDKPFAEGRKQQFGSWTSAATDGSVEDDADESEAQDAGALAPAPGRFDPPAQRSGGAGPKIGPETGSESDREAKPKQDELLLDASRLVEADEDVQPLHRRRRVIGAAADEDEPTSQVPADPATKTRSSGGSTLFERMAGLSRAQAPVPDGDEDADEDGADMASMRIPRFLNRQNNQ